VVAAGTASLSPGRGPVSVADARGGSDMEAASTRGTLVVALAILIGLVPAVLVAQAKGDPAAGQAVFKARCANCHGTTGAGDGPAGKVLKDKPQDWTKGEGLKGLTDQQLYDSIKKGGKAIGKSPVMIAFPGLSDAEIWSVIAYIKTLPKS
jgi:mono/diheme cytochrome c family protein